MLNSSGYGHTDSYCIPIIPDQNSLNHEPNQTWEQAVQSDMDIPCFEIK